MDLAQAAAAMQNPFDLALIELHLPDKDGFETARLLKDHAATSTMRLVILTTVGRRGDGTTARQLGINAYLTKPLRQTQLLECFCQVLDVAKTDAAPIEASPGTPPLITRHTLGQSSTAATTRLLLAEDNPVNQRVLGNQLEYLGLEVVPCVNGLEAVARVKAGEGVLVLMDCEMPEMDGYEASRKIREWERANKRAPIPIIAVTAHVMAGALEQCLECGMSSYLDRKSTRLNSSHQI